MVQRMSRLSESASVYRGSPPSAFTSPLFLNLVCTSAHAQPAITIATATLTTWMFKEATGEERKVESRK